MWIALSSTWRYLQLKNFYHFKCQCHILQFWSRLKLSIRNVNNLPSTTILYNYCRKVIGAILFIEYTRVFACSSSFISLTQWFPTWDLLILFLTNCIFNVIIFYVCSHHSDEIVLIFLISYYRKFNWKRG